MDPEVKSIVSSVALSGATSIAVWAAGHGIVPASDESNLANTLVTVAFGLGALAIGWYKKRQMSQTAMIAAVNNADNGVKVVAETTPAPKVDAPMK